MMPVVITYRLYLAFSVFASAGLVGLFQRLKPYIAYREVYTSIFAQ